MGCSFQQLMAMEHGARTNSHKGNPGGMRLDVQKQEWCNEGQTGCTGGRWMHSRVRRQKRAMMRRRKRRERKPRFGRPQAAGSSQLWARVVGWVQIPQGYWASPGGGRLVASMRASLGQRVTGRWSGTRRAPHLASSAACLAKGQLSC